MDCMQQQQQSLLAFPYTYMVLPITQKLKKKKKNPLE